MLRARPCHRSHRLHAGLMQYGVVLGALLLGVAAWEPVRPGVWYRESQMAARGSLAPVRVAAVRIDPSLVRFSLQAAPRDDGTTRGWSIDRMGANDMVAFNAGQFGAGGS